MDEDAFDQGKAAKLRGMSAEEHLTAAARKFTSTNARRDGSEETRVASAQIHLGMATVQLLQRISHQLEAITGQAGEPTK